MTINCSGFPMGFFFGTTEEGKMFIGKIDPVTKKVLVIYELVYED